MTNCRRGYLLILLCLCSTVAKADIWVDQALGGSNNGVIAGIQGNYAVDNNVYALRLSFFGDINCCDEYASFSASYGFRERGKYSTTVFQAGIGVIERVYSDSTESREDYSLSIPFSVSYIVGKYVGLGFHLNVNINDIQPMVGVSVGWSYGQFR